ncbi:Ig-like domain-containing protein [Bacillus sp. S3]|uniref:Ig-like domain-containing protein n=1 Tax=Bacillus sp. S3 TaxID=486398 RepID=UPI00168089CA|nr:Ig-like domain-containing protein [Bacillus sp. S3]
MRKVFSNSLKIVVAFLLVFSSFQGVAKAFWDSTPPEIKSVQVDKTQAFDGETVTLSINAIDLETSIKDADIRYTDGRGFPQSFKGIYNQETQVLQVKIPISKSSSLGNWSIKSIWFNSTNGDFKTVDSSNTDLSGGSFQVIEKRDNDSPIFNGMTIDKSELVLGGTNKVSIKAVDALSGIAEVKVGYQTPSGEIQEQNAAFNWFNNSYDATISTSTFSNIGKWQPAYVYLRDKKGNATTIYHSGLYNSGIIADLSSGAFQVLEDKGESLDTLNRTIVYTSNAELTDTTINGDVYIGPSAILTINGNVTINGDLIIFGSYRLNGSLDVNGTLDLTGSMDQVPIYLADQPLTAINGVLKVSGKTVPLVSMTIENQPVAIHADGTFLLNNLNVAGKEGITIKFTDPSGHESVRQFLIKQETKTAPSAPIVMGITDKDTLVSGTAEAGAKVEIKVKGLVIGEGEAGNNGAFAITIPAQKAGTELVVTAIDSFGTVSETTIVVVKDVTAPAAPQVNEVTDQSTEISGKTEVGATVTVAIDSVREGLSTYTSVVGDSGIFKVAIPLQAAGTVITVMATDKAGNASEVSTVIVKDATPPAKPVVNEVNDQSTTVSGTAEADSTIDITVNNSIIGSTTTRGDGTFTVSIPVQTAGTELVITARDQAGNSSERAIVIVKDVTAPLKPYVEKVTDHKVMVSGTAELNSTVEVRANGILLGSSRADTGAGWYWIEIPPQKAGTELSIIAIDASGHHSEATIIIVEKDPYPMSGPKVDRLLDTDTAIKGQAGFAQMIKVWKNDVLLASKLTENDGSFSLDIPAQPVGTKLLVTATDTATYVISDPTVVVVGEGIAPGKPSVNTVNDQDTSVSGTAEAGSKVEVNVNGQVIGFGTAGTDGTFSITIPVQKEGTELVVTATDQYGNVSEATTLVVTDGTAPAAPQVDDVTNQSLEVSGKAEVNAKITVAINSEHNGLASYTGVADENGAFKVTIPVQAAGTVITVMATDKDGNMSKTTTVVVRDVIAPVKPIVNPVTDKDTVVTGYVEAGSKVSVSVNHSVIGVTDTGNDRYFSITIPIQYAGTQLVITATDKDGNTSEPATVFVQDVTAPDKPMVRMVMDNEPFVAGTAEVEAIIDVKVNGSTIGTGRVSAEGTFKVTIPVQKAGTELALTATDIAGNSSKAEIVVVQDGTAPAKPVVNEVTDKATAVTGSAEAGSKVEVKADGSVIGFATAGTDGKFSVPIPLQKSGVELAVTATDKDGNVSEATKVVVKDGTSPAKPVVNEVTDKDSAVTGSAEAGSKVEVKVAESVIGFATTGTDGKFSVTIPVQKAGVELVVTATDKDGNVSEVTMVVVKDVTSPAKPVVNEVTDKDSAVTGSAEAGSKVEVKVAGSVIGFATAGTNGKFSVTIPVQKAGIELVVTAADIAGNVSDAVTVVVKDVTAPAKPFVNEVNDKDTIVSGQAEAGSKVEVVAYGAMIGSGTAGNDGIFTVSIPMQTEETELLITATDKSGNMSEATKVIVKDEGAPDVPVVDEVSNLATWVSGHAEADSTIEVTLNGSVIGSGITGTNGEFLINIPVLKEGTELQITATDRKGNKSQPIKVVVIDRIPPKSPIVNIVTDQDLHITGTAEAGSFIKVIYKSGSVIGSGKTGPDGKYSVEIPAYPNPGSEFTVTATDAAGNESQPTKFIVVSGIKGWVQTDHKWFYYDVQTGKPVKGWLSDAGKWYFLDSNGVMKTGWFLDGSTWYFFKGSGAMQTGWLLDGSTWYYFNGSGAMKTGWLLNGSTWYFFTNSGAMRTGWLQSGSTWYYLKSSGAMQTGWLLDGSTWYYFNGSGAMKTGWLLSGKTWYYFKSSGAMQTGWAQISGKWYYFNQSGALK